MKENAIYHRFSPVFFPAIWLIFQPVLSSQTCRDVSIVLRAEWQAEPPSVTLHWAGHGPAQGYTLYRKPAQAQTWGMPVAVLPGNTTLYTDNTVAAGITYEYRCTMQAPGYTGYGYIRSGIEIPPVERRGKLILLVDDRFAAPLAYEIERLIADLEGDGWIVIRHDVQGTTPVPEVKQLIVATYQLDPSNTKSLFLLGRLPVPYSGVINPDGHPDHIGAWPADAYYADMDGPWTDITANTTAAASSRHHNIPGDGKFDPSSIPGDLELQTGRVDFSNMPAFALSEEELLRQYLDKDHAYRRRHFEPVHRALIDDNFGYFGGEAFAAGGWRNFTSLVGGDHVEAGDYFTSLQQDSYLWSYGCGGGSYTGADGIGNTQGFAANALEGVFTMLFGSYFGDWDSQNNFLRAPLASGKTLTNAWSGRPHWVFHPMGMGETIGYCAWLSQNNANTYSTGYGARSIHIALMGDPTLRNHIVAPVTDVEAVAAGDGAYLSWDASPDAISGYYIYFRPDGNAEFTRLNNEPVTELFYEIPCVHENGTHRYMVRALKPEESPGGMYYNLSQGTMAALEHKGIVQAVAGAAWEIQENIVSFENHSVNADSFLWIFGDGESSTDTHPVHTYADGFFNGYLVAYTACSADTFYFDLDIFTSAADIGETHAWKITPNPSTGIFTLHQAGENNTPHDLRVFTMQGNLVFHATGIHHTIRIDLSAQPAGTYIAEIKNHSGIRVVKLILQR